MPFPFTKRSVMDSQGTTPSTFSAGSRFMLIAAAFVIVIAGLKLSSAILNPFLMAAFIAIICAPPLFWLQRQGFSQGFSVFMVIGGLLLLTTLLGMFLGTSIQDFSKQMPEYKEKLQSDMGNLQNWLASKNIKIPENFFEEYLDPGMAMQLVGNTLAGLGGAVTNIFLVLLTVAFILSEAAGFPMKMRLALKDPTDILSHYSRFLKTVNQYLAIKTWVSLATGIVVGLTLWALGVDFPALWGLVAFLLNYVPNIGSIIAAAPPVLLSFIQFGFLKAGLVVGLFVGVNTLFGNYIEPRYMGRGLGLSTLVVFLSLAFWGWILGPIGMLLSVPLTMIVKILMESREETRWVSILLGSSPTPDAIPDSSHKKEEEK